MNDFFYNPTKGKVSWGNLSGEIREFILTDSQSTYKLIIGSDSRSKRRQDKMDIDLVTAIVIHRKGRGGRYFWNKKIIRNIYSLKEKLYQETMASLATAEKLLGILKEDLNGQFKVLEIHIDIGKNGPSREMIQELVGMVAGNGFAAKIKPAAYAASSVADKYT